MTAVKKHDQELASNNHESASHVTMFEGQKNFWRARVNVDLRIVEHTVAHVIEVICYNADLNAESPRIFLDSNRLYKKLDAAEIDEKVNLKREELARLRKRVPLEEMQQGIVRQLAVTYIQARLQIATKDVQEIPTIKEVEESEADENQISTEHSAPTKVAQAAEDNAGFYVELQAASGDSSHAISDIVLHQRPTGLDDIVIQRRKKTTMQDFHKEMRALRADHHQLNNACAHASRKAGLAVQSTDAFKGMLRNRNSLDESHLSIATKRWLWAGQKVILQNYVAAVHRRLERYSMSAIPSESVTKQGQELKDKLKMLSGNMRGLRQSQSSLKLPSLQDSSRDARRGSRSSRDGTPCRNSMTRLSLTKLPRECTDFTRSFSIHVQERIEARQNGTVETRRSRTESFDSTPSMTLPVITSPQQ